MHKHQVPIDDKAAATKASASNGGAADTAVKHTVHLESGKQATDTDTTKGPAATDGTTPPPPTDATTDTTAAAAEVEDGAPTEGAPVGAPKEKEMALPFEKMALVFRNIDYYVPMPGGKRGEELQLLKKCWGAFRPGVLTALMGASGAGKTTLMDLLAGMEGGGGGVLEMVVVVIGGGGDWWWWWLHSCSTYMCMHACSQYNNTPTFPHFSMVHTRVLHPTQNTHMLHPKTHTHTHAPPSCSPSHTPTHPHTRSQVSGSH